MDLETLIKATELAPILDVPGIKTLLASAPLFAGSMWLLITALLWNNGFNDLIEQITRPRWTRQQSINAAAMIPLRGLMLTLVAGLGALSISVGILFNIGIILNIVSSVNEFLTP